MTMTFVQNNIVGEIQTIASELISIQSRLTTITTMYINEGVGDLVDADFAELPMYAHINATEFQAAALALSAVNTALGTNTTSNWAKLLRIIPGIPK